MAVAVAGTVQVGPLPAHAQNPRPGLVEGPSGAAIPGQYIVRFRGNADARVEAKALAAAGSEVLDVYEHAVKAAAVRLPSAAIAGLRRNPRVLDIEPDRIFTASQEPAAPTMQTSPPWGLDRIDQRELPLTGSYEYPAAGAGVNAYVIDSGVYAGHDQFGGRVREGFSAIADGLSTEDCYGHGTHIAGIVGGSTYGVAKAVTIVPVRVLNCRGNALASRILAGIDWAVQDHEAGVPAVANLSFGTLNSSEAVEAAVQSLIDDGVLVVVAAGNHSGDACSVTPAKVPSALTVGATTDTDARASYSNYGTCLDLFAPGAGIKSAYIGTTSSATSLGGTSFAAPHVAGAVAVLLEQEPSLTPAQVSARINDDATLGLVTGKGAGSPNRLLHSPSGAPRPAPPPNDDFADATSFTFAETPLMGSTVAATKQADEPYHAGNGGAHSAWWQFTAPATGTVSLTTQGSTFDTVMAVNCQPRLTEAPGCKRRLVGPGLESDPRPGQVR